MRERCRTISEALDTIRSLDELEGFVAALRDPAMPTKEASEADWQRIAHLKIQLQRREHERRGKDQPDLQAGTGRRR